MRAPKLRPATQTQKEEKETHTSQRGSNQQRVGLAIVTGRPSYLSTFTYLPIHIFTLTYIETHRLKKPHTELDVVVATRHVVVLSMCMCVNGKWIGHTKKHTQTQKLKKVKNETKQQVRLWWHGICQNKHTYASRTHVNARRDLVTHDTHRRQT